MFSVEERAAARDYVLTLASEDPRISAAALVGSFARDSEDRWSDVDLTFAVNDDVALGDVIGDWTRQLEAILGAVHLWDGQVRYRTYRVFLLPGWLQLDLSFTPASEFRPGGPAFRLLFGHAGQIDLPPAQTPHQVFGWGAIQAIHARRCIERERYWQAEQAIGEIRECALSLACLQYGLEPSHGRGFDDLPPDTLAAASATLPASVEPDQLQVALVGAVHLLLSQASDARVLEQRVERDLRGLAEAR